MALDLHLKVVRMIRPASAAMNSHAKPIDRPVNLSVNPAVFHFPFAALASITHRISGRGAVLSVWALLLYWLDRSIWHRRKPASPQWRQSPWIQNTSHGSSWCGRWPTTSSPASSICCSIFTSAIRWRRGHTAAAQIAVGADAWYRRRAAGRSGYGNECHQLRAAVACLILYCSGCTAVILAAYSLWVLRLLC